MMHRNLDRKAQNALVATNRVDKLECTGKPINLPSRIKKLISGFSHIDEWRQLTAWGLGYTPKFQL